MNKEECLVGEIELEIHSTIKEVISFYELIVSRPQNFRVVRYASRHLNGQLSEQERCQIGSPNASGFCFPTHLVVMIKTDQWRKHSSAEQHILSLPFIKLEHSK